MDLRLSLVLLVVLLREISASRCPRECLCLSQIQVLCNTGNLTEIPADFPAQTQEIVITSQNIRQIRPKAFSHLKQLRRLILDSNSIAKIHPLAFKDLHDLTDISVQNNRLKELAPFSFAGIRNVTNLYLGYNQINKIDGSAFAGSEDITMLLLNDNPIKEVKPNAFSGLKKVEFVFLPAGVRHLGPRAFDGLERVGMLKLAYLDLHELQPNTFYGLNEVRTLVIENSDLATIRAGAFQGMRNVGELKIVNNKIDDIEDFTLGSNEVKNLTFRGNHILRVPIAAAVNAINVNVVVWDDNHFPCSCRILFLLESNLANNNNNRGKESFMSRNKCISPGNLKGRPIRDMERRGILAECDKHGFSREERKVKQRETQRKRLRIIEKMRKKQQEREKMAQNKEKDAANNYVGRTTTTTEMTANSSSKIQPLEFVSLLTALIWAQKAYFMRN